MRGHGWEDTLEVPIIENKATEEAIAEVLEVRISQKFAVIEIYKFYVYLLINIGRFLSRLLCARIQRLVLIFFYFLLRLGFETLLSRKDSHK